jgi:hypothetical protein
MKFSLFVCDYCGKKETTDASMKAPKGWCVSSSDEDRSFYARGAGRQMELTFCGPTHLRAFREIERTAMQKAVDYFKAELMVARGAVESLAELATMSPGDVNPASIDDDQDMPF